MRISLLLSAGALFITTALNAAYYSDDGYNGEYRNKSYYTNDNNYYNTDSTPYYQGNRDGYYYENKAKVRGPQSVYMKGPRYSYSEETRSSNDRTYQDNQGNWDGKMYQDGDHRINVKVQDGKGRWDDRNLEDGKRRSLDVRIEESPKRWNDGNTVNQPRRVWIDRDADLDDNYQNSKDSYGDRENQLSDRELLDRIHNELEQSSERIKFKDVIVEVSDGVVTIIGIVDTNEDKQNVKRKIANVSGVRNVDDRLEIRGQKASLNR